MTKQRKISGWIIILLLIIHTNSCSDGKPQDEVLSQNINLAISKYKTMANKIEAKEFPSGIDDNGEIRVVKPQNWVSGFYPSSLWYLYELTGDKEIKRYAEKWTHDLERQKFNTSGHDIGFVINCSFGNALRLTGNESYKEVIVTAAKSLSERYNPNIGCTKSWDFFNGPDKWKQFPVIIDNMMNLELLFNATKISGDSSFYYIAFNHAKTTMENHFRSDYSAYHVVDYDTVSGEVIKKMTSQGYADESAWARGQAWAIYGFTYCYRETKHIPFLETAIKTADFFLSQTKDMPDHIPYWDFNAPDIPNAPRDASAAAITASALLELKDYVDDIKGIEYSNRAKEIILSLSSPEYFTINETDNPFLLKHSTGHWPMGKEIDKPLIYADYYYLEAIVRYLQAIKHQY